MGRFERIIDAVSGKETIRPFTAEEEAAADEAERIPIPDRVTARQFKMQLEKQGLLDGVEAWIGRQEKLVRIAYENSGSFVRDEPMMQAGFSALGFKPEQIDAFFSSASAI